VVGARLIPIRSFDRNDDIDMVPSFRRLCAAALRRMSPAMPRRMALAALRRMSPAAPRRMTLAMSCLIALVGARAEAQTRLALVIGNGGCSSAPLANARNDARLVVAALTDAGFAVTAVIDADQRALKQSVRAFAGRLEAAGEDAAAAFHYAGHGMQINGRNYLIPVNAPLRSAVDVDYETVEAQWVLDKIGASGVSLSIIMFDACRDNPFPSISRGAAGGLARMDAPRGSILGYSTAPGDVALDGRGANSPCTSALVQAVRTPELKIGDAFKQVRRAVLVETDARQATWESASLVGDSYFTGGPQSAAYAPAAPAAPLSPPAAAVLCGCLECPDMVALPGGAFSVSSAPSEPGHEAVEGPSVPVAIRSFARRAPQLLCAGAHRGDARRLRAFRRRDWARDQAGLLGLGGDPAVRWRARVEHAGLCASRHASRGLRVMGRCRRLCRGDGGPHGAAASPAVRGAVGICRWRRRRHALGR
jgi:hypothetical protein